MRKFYSLLFCASMLLACDKPSELAGGETSQELILGYSIEPQSRVATDVGSGQQIFEPGDEISVTMLRADESEYRSDVTYVCSDDSMYFSSVEPIRLDEGIAERGYIIYAVYPKQEIKDNAVFYDALADQSSEENFVKSDLLVTLRYSFTYAGWIIPNPKLQFNHAMSTLIINIPNEDMWGGELKVYAKTRCEYSVTEGRAYSLDESPVVEIIPAANGDGSYKAIIAPQMIHAGELVATYELNGVKYGWVANRDQDFMKGVRRIYNWEEFQTLE